jgi:DNA-binding PadR family transcriptional regulator
MPNEQLKGHLELLLLEVLSSGPVHGYDVITRLRDRSDGIFDLPEGTVYPALHRLEKSGLLQSSWSADGGRRRRLYALTREGHAALAKQRDGWKRFANGMHAVLGVAT